MTEKQIEQDKQKRVTEAKKEISDVLKKYELDIMAEDMIGEHTKIKVMVQFVDTKQYPQADLAQPDRPVVTEDQIKDIMQGKGDAI